MGNNASNNKAEKRFSYWVLVLPAVLIYLFVMAFPVIFSVFLSFTDYNVYRNTAVITGLKNFKTMFSDPLFWLCLRNNAYIIIMSVFIQVPLGFILAYIIFRKLIKLRRLFQSVIFVPTMISTIIIGVLWASIFNPFGVFTNMMKLVYGRGYVNKIFMDPNLAMVPVLFVMLWMYVGTYLVIFLANMQKIDDSMIEAARVDGAGEMQILLNIILPNMSGVVVTSIILAVSGSLSSFNLLWAMTGGGPNHYTAVLGVYLYEKGFQYFDYSFASAVSTFLVVLSFILIGITQLINRKFGGRED